MCGCKPTVGSNPTATAADLRKRRSAPSRSRPAFRRSFSCLVSIESTRVANRPFARVHPRSRPSVSPTFGTRYTLPKRAPWRSRPSAGDRLRGVVSCFRARPAAQPLPPSARGKQHHGRHQSREATLLSSLFVGAAASRQRMITQRAVPLWSGEHCSCFRPQSGPTLYRAPSPGGRPRHRTGSDRGPIGPRNRG